MEIQPVVIGTAGHIDHGKSSLVRALTGVDPDRWREEKERGLTIDLGFAPLELPDGRLVGIVDVPGHERFIKNMVAGATGIDLVLLVVAADDGVMPQTREHLDIMRLLGVAAGLVALTKVDAVEPEMAELAAEDVRDAVAGTFLEGAPILPVSSVTGEGLKALRRALTEAAAEARPRSDAGVFRMPVQRVFSARGFGTIVTGIPLSGAVRVGQTLEVLPGGLRGKVRGLQAYGHPTERARAGHSTAINLTDVERSAVARGHVVAEPGYFRAVRMLGATCTALPSLDRAIENRTEVRLHVGTAEALGEVVVLDRARIEPGQEALVQIRLREAVVCAPGDRFVVRRASPLVTLGGGVVVEESRYRLKRFKGFVLEELRLQEQGLASPRDLLAACLARAQEPATAEELAVAVKRPRAEVVSLLEELCGEGRAARAGARFLDAGRLEEAVEGVVAEVAAWFERNPHREVLEVLELARQSGLERSWLDLLIGVAEERGRLELRPGGRLALPGRAGRLAPEQEALASELLGRLTSARYQPPPPPELATSLGVSEEDLVPLLQALLDRGELHRVSAEIYLPEELYQAARSLVVRNCEANGELAIPALRDALGTSRKYLIPLLEYFDSQGVTLRQGGRRILRRS